MPVRIGYPVGVKGITQLVQGPQFATGVGLVKYGAQALAEARAIESEERQSFIKQGQPEPEPAPKKRSSFMDWLKAAF